MAKNDRQKIGPALFWTGVVGAVAINPPLGIGTAVAGLIVSAAEIAKDTAQTEAKKQIGPENQKSGFKERG